MKSLKESLFDNNLIQKDLGTLEVIVAHIENYLSEKETEAAWKKCLNDISKTIKYSDKGGWNLLGRSIPNNIKNDELYVSIDIDHCSLLLMARGLIGSREFSHEACPLTVIGYSRSGGFIYADVYRTGTGTMDYHYILNRYKGTFQWYKINPKETKSFVDNVFDKIEQVF